MKAGVGKSSEGGGASRLPRPAELYLGLTVAAAAGASAFSLPQLGSGRGDWLAFGLLTLGAALSQLFVVKTTSNQAYYTTTVFIVAAALLLPPEMVVLVAVLAHLPEWIKYRYPWYIQTFNIANYVLAGLAAWGAAQLGARTTGALGFSELEFAGVGMIASIAFVFLNHATLAEMLRRARGHSYRASGLFTPENLTTDFALAALGICIAGLWHVNPALVLFGTAPLVLVHRALALPRLEEEAKLDVKTGLYNARYLDRALRDEVERAHRFQRSLAVIVADLDLLRDVNNTYGHLAGDAVLRGVADIIRSQIRPYDVAARFGGEEFAVVLPEADTEQALEVAERIRAAVAATIFALPNCHGSIHATLSIGVACHRAGGTPEELMHRADLALYEAKARGRNRVSAVPVETPLPDEPPTEIAVLQAMNVTEEPSFEEEHAQRGRLGTSLSSLMTGARAVAEQATRRRADRRRLVGAFVAAVLVGGVGLLASDFSTLIEALAERQSELAAFALLTLSLQFFSVQLHGAGREAASAVGLLATGFVFGAAPAAAVGVAAAALHSARRRAPVHRGAFDVGNFALSAGGAAAVYHALDPALPLPVAALVSGVAFKATNIGLLCTAMALAERRSTAAVWNERFRWATVYHLTYGLLAYAAVVAYSKLGFVGLLAFLLPPALVTFSMRQYVERTRRAVEEISSANAELEQANAELAASRERLRRTHLATIAALSRSMEAKDYYTGGHTDRVSAVAVALAKRLGYSGDELEAIEFGAVLHDVGKIGIPEAILQKAGPLTDDEWEIVRQHPIISEYIVSDVELHPIVRQIVRSSHEHIDGTGYPDRLAGEEIPLPARIVLVADALDALTSDRPYRAARPPETALAEIRAHAGTQFCPIVVAALDSIAHDDPDLLGLSASRSRQRRPAGASRSLRPAVPTAALRRLRTSA